jgi:hypothetical protein
MVINFKEYLEVQKYGTLNVFDIDDTLFHTTAKISVIKDGKPVKELSNQEFNTYQLKSGESFDFSQFRDSEKFYQESKPISRMLDKVSIILKRSESNPLSKVVIVTARANFNDKNKFLDTFRKHKFDIDKVRVERAGNINDVEDIAFKKVIIIRNYINTNMFNKVRLFDDSMANLKAFLKLKSEFPNVQFEAYFAKTDGTIKTVK